MNTLVEYNLSLILFLPWFAILSVLFWRYPRQPRTAARRAFDAISLLAALIAFLLGIHWSFDHADPRYGKLWPQILATALGYGIWLGTMALAFFARGRWLRRLAANKTP